MENSFRTHNAAFSELVEAFIEILALIDSAEIR
jgi:hypothetical protein